MRADKILLVYPPNNKHSTMVGALMEPLALEYIAAAFQGKEVQIMDLRLENDISRRISYFKPDIVGFSAFSTHVKVTIELARQVKKMCPETFIMVGGHHATVRPQDFDIPEIDFIVVGEGCSVIKDILSCGENYESVKGLCYQKNGKRIYNLPSEHPALDSLPLPRRDLVAKYSKYYYYTNIRPVATMRTSVGCYYRCKFCSVWGIVGGRYLKRGIDAVVQEMRGIDADTIFFADDESMLDYKSMFELAGAIQKAGIKKRFILWARADTVIKYPDLFEKWKEVGLSRVLVGYESYSDGGLRKYNKSLTTVEQGKATAILKNIGLLIEAQMIIDPSFSREDFAGMQSFIRKMGLSNTTFGILTPLPGSMLYEEMNMDAVEKDWDLFDAEHAVLPLKLPKGKFYSLYNSLCKVSWPLTERIGIMVNDLLAKIVKLSGIV